MGISREGAGQLYRYIIFPLGIIGLVISLFGGFGEDTVPMIFASIFCIVVGFLGPKIF